VAKKLKLGDESGHSMKADSWGAAYCVFGILLTGCGGSGGGDGRATPAGTANLTSVPGETALVHYLQTSHQNTFNASNGGNAYSLLSTSVPIAGTTTFNGSAPAYIRVATVAISSDGTLVANNIWIDYFLLNPYVPLGEVSSTGSPYGVVTSSSPVPATLAVGDSGAVYALTFFHDATMRVIDANTTVAYSVKANDSATLLLCLNSVVADVTGQGTADGLADGSASDCYTVDSAGNATLVSITRSVNDVTLTFQ
jgi:hypothetical protein